MTSDDDALKRARTDEQMRADREASEKVVDDVAAAVSCIEAGGAGTPRINSQAGRETQAYLSKHEGKVVDGVGGAFRWHNLVASERLLIAARETLPKITHLAAAVSREELEFRINGTLAKVKPLRQEAARSAVEDIGRNRAYAYGACLVFFFVTFALIAALTGDWWGFVIFPAALAGAGALAVTDWGKVRAPIHYEDIAREAGVGSRAGRRAWFATGAVCFVGLLGGLLSIAARSYKPTDVSPCARVRGQWASEIHIFTGTEFGPPNKTLDVDTHAIRIWSNKIEALPGDPRRGSPTGYIGWNTQNPTQEGSSCVYVTREVLSGAGVGPNNPYASVRKITLTPQADGVGVAIENEDPAIALCTGTASECAKDGHYAPDKVEQTKAGFKSLNGSFWKSAPPTQ